MMEQDMTAGEVIERLQLQPHPEGGWYRQTLLDPSPEGGRARSTAIYYLLEAGDRSHWHRVDATEVWHFYTGAPLALSMSADGQGITRQVLGPDLGDGEVPQAAVPSGYWQSAGSLGIWTLCGCTVAPGFEFSGFELAPDGWTPDAR